MITKLGENVMTNRAWNGRDDIHQHYVGHFPVRERVLTLTLAWKREKHSPLWPIGKFRIEMDRLVEDGLARIHQGAYVLRFQRTGRRIEIAINRASRAHQLVALPPAFFENRGVAKDVGS